jgi:hypothetical protein
MAFSILFDLMVITGCAVGASKIAERKGRNARHWAVVGLVLGLFGLAIAYVMPEIPVTDDDLL